MFQIENKGRHSHEELNEQNNSTHIRPEIIKLI